MIESPETQQLAHALEGPVREWVLRGFQPNFDGKSFAVDARWQAVRNAGTELWLDTGDIAGINKLWTGDFSALTTNNTLLNKEVQRGQYDQLVRDTAQELRRHAGSMSDDLLVLETAFVLNAWHGLRLVEGFDAFVSVEEHTDLANNIELAVLYAKRFHAICPERFIVKLPLTPEGLLAMRRLRNDGIPVNFTLGFSARHNVLAARVGNPTWVNVFLGRLNAFTADHKLGTGDGVGEKATIASQEQIRSLRQQGKAATRQIAASLRGGEQLWSLAGTDVLTIPLAVADAYHTSERAPVAGMGPASADVQPDVDAAAAGALHYEKLWDVPDAFHAAMDALCARDLENMTGPELVGCLHDNGVVDLFPEYSSAEMGHFQSDGKIPNLERWRARLEQGTTALDELLNMSGLYSFATDQKQLDDRVRGLLDL